MGFLFGLLGGFGSILRAIPARAWLVIGAVALVLIVGWRVQAWAHGKDVALANSQAQTRAAYQRQAATITWAGRLQQNWIIEVGNRVRITAAADRQTAMVRAQADASARAAQTAQDGLRRALATHTRDDARLAALARPVAGVTACERAENRRAAVLEALR